MHTADKDWWLAHSADYVLGVLGDQDRKVFERIMHFEPDVQAMVRDWRKTLQPMADALPAVDAPDHILPNLLSDLPEQIVQPVTLNYQHGEALNGNEVITGTALVAGAAAVGGSVATDQTHVVDSDLDFLDDSTNALPAVQQADHQIEPAQPLEIEGSSVMNLISKHRQSADRWRGYAGWITVACIGLAGWVYYLYS